MEVGTIATVIGTGLAVIGLQYQIMRNFKDDIKAELRSQDEKFKLHEKRFEKMDQRLFLLCLGKDLPSILKSEREEK